MHLAVYGFSAVLKHYAELAIGLGGGFVHLAHLTGVHARRLFGHDMQIVFESLYRVFGMEVMRHRYYYSVDESGLHHVLGVVKVADVLIANYILYGGQFIRVLIAYRCELCFRNLACYEVARMGSSHVAQTDYAESYLIHVHTSCHCIPMSSSRVCSACAAAAHLPAFVPDTCVLLVR